MSIPEDEQAAGRQPSEEELRAAYEEEIKKIRVEHVLLEQVVTLVNLGMRRTGLAPGTEEERDRDQVGLAIESVRTLLPLIEQIAPEQVRPIRDAVSQLQMAYVRIGGPAEAPAPDAGATGTSTPTGQEAPGGGQAPAGAPASGEGPGPAQRSGRLWTPGS